MCSLYIIIHPAFINSPIKGVSTELCPSNNVPVKIYNYHYNLWHKHKIVKPLLFTQLYHIFSIFLNQHLLIHCTESSQFLYFQERIIVSMIRLMQLYQDALNGLILITNLISSPISTVSILRLYSLFSQTFSANTFFVYTFLCTFSACAWSHGQKKVLLQEFQFCISHFDIKENLNCIQEKLYIFF